MANLALTQLIDVACEFRGREIRVIMDQWQIERMKILDELKEIYTEQEYEQIKEGIDSFDVLPLLQELEQSYEDEWD